MFSFSAWPEIFAVDCIIGNLRRYDRRREFDLKDFERPGIGFERRLLKTKFIRRKTKARWGTLASSGVGVNLAVPVRISSARVTLLIRVQYGKQSDNVQVQHSAKLESGRVTSSILTPGRVRHQR